MWGESACCWTSHFKDLNHIFDHSAPSKWKQMNFSTQRNSIHDKYDSVWCCCTIICIINQLQHYLLNCDVKDPWWTSGIVSLHLPMKDLWNICKNIANIIHISCVTSSLCDVPRCFKTPSLSSSHTQGVNPNTSATAVSPQHMHLMI